MIEYENRENIMTWLDKMPSQILCLLFSLHIPTCIGPCLWTVQWSLGTVQQVQRLRKKEILWSLFPDPPAPSNLFCRMLGFWGGWGLGNPNLVRILITVRNIGRSLSSIVLLLPCCMWGVWIWIHKHNNVRPYFLSIRQRLSFLLVKNWVWDCHPINTHICF